MYMGLQGERTVENTRNKPSGEPRLERYTGRREAERVMGRIADDETSLIATKAIPSPTQAPGELEIFLHERHTFAVDSAQIAVEKQSKTRRVSIFMDKLIRARYNESTYASSNR